MTPNRRKEIEAWWRSPVASILLVVSGLSVVFIEVSRGSHATGLGYSAGLALVGLGITGRLQSWAIQDKKKAETEEEEETI